MTKKLDLTGQKFGKLTVIKPAPGIPNGPGGRVFSAWSCQCECGGTKIVRTTMLQDGTSVCCGCTFDLRRVSLKPGQKFNRLTIISYQGNSRWLCQCDCGQTAIVGTRHLKSGNTKSCGCLKSEVNSEPTKLRKFTSSNKKFEPHITTARRRWKSCLYQDRECNLTFEQWFQLVQQNCFYCGIEPFNRYNYFEKKKNASREARDNGYFTSHGLDRIDSSKPHTLDNVVPCCFPCNGVKSNRPLQDFYQHVNKMKSDNVFIPPTTLLTLPTGYLLVSIKCAYRHYKRNYGSMEIDLQTFYTYSQLPCFYCGLEKGNYFNVYLKDKKASQTAKDGAHFHYNGIDRIDNSQKHVLNNIIPCCKWCNAAKSDSLLADFQNWIRRIQKHQKKKSPVE
jgi:hypothetical protein